MSIVDKLAKMLKSIDKDTLDLGIGSLSKLTEYGASLSEI